MNALNTSSLTRIWGFSTLFIIQNLVRGVCFGWTYYPSWETIDYCWIKGVSMLVSDIMKWKMDMLVYRPFGEVENSNFDIILGGIGLSAFRQCAVVTWLEHKIITSMKPLWSYRYFLLSWNYITLHVVVFDNFHTYNLRHLFEEWWRDEITNVDFGIKNLKNFHQQSERYI